jgi:hypothetical protein
VVFINAQTRVILFKDRVKTYVHAFLQFDTLAGLHGVAILHNIFKCLIFCLLVGRLFCKQTPIEFLSAPVVSPHFMPHPPQNSLHSAVNHVHPPPWLQGGHPGVGVFRDASLSEL